VVGAATTTTTRVGTAPPPTTDCGATAVDDGYDRGGSRRGEDDVSSPTADLRTMIPGGEIVARRRRSTPSTAATGGGSPARRRQRRRANERQRRRWPRRRRRRQRSRVVPRPSGRGSRGQTTSRAARARTTLQRGRTVGGVAMTTGGPGNGDVKAPAVGATDCLQRLSREAARVGGGVLRRQPTRAGGR
jgi:hypothetical protein